MSTDHVAAGLETVESEKFGSGFTPEALLYPKDTRTPEVYAALFERETASPKEVLDQVTDLPRQTLYDSIKRLQQAEIVEDVARGTYRVTRPAPFPETIYAIDDIGSLRQYQVLRILDSDGESSVSDLAENFPDTHYDSVARATFDLHERGLVVRNTETYRSSKKLYRLTEAGGDVTNERSTTYRSNGSTRHVEDLTDTKLHMMELLDGNDSLSAQDIAASIDRTAGHARRYLNQLCDMGLADYRHSNEPTSHGAVRYQYSITPRVHTMLQDIDRVQQGEARLDPGVYDLDPMPFKQLRHLLGGIDTDEETAQYAEEVRTALRTLPSPDRGWGVRDSVDSLRLYNWLKKREYDEENLPLKNQFSKMLGALATFDDFSEEKQPGTSKKRRVNIEPFPEREDVIMHSINHRYIHDSYPSAYTTESIVLHSDVDHTAYLSAVNDIPPTQFGLLQEYLSDVPNEVDGNVAERVERNNAIWNALYDIPAKYTFENGYEIQKENISGNDVKRYLADQSIEDDLVPSPSGLGHVISALATLDPVPVTKNTASSHGSGQKYRIGDLARVDQYGTRYAIRQRVVQNGEA